MWLLRAEPGGVEEWRRKEAFDRVTHPETDIGRYRQMVLRRLQEDAQQHREKG